MIISDNDAFMIEYFEDHPDAYPDGYYEVSIATGHTGVGATEHDAMADLINILVRALDAAIAVGPPIAN